MTVASIEHDSRQAAASEPYRVMVVDDSLVVRALLTRALGADPAIKVVASAGNGKAALDELKKQEVDVVLLDIEMPVMDGVTTLPQLIAGQPGIQVVMASTLTLKGASISMKAMALGAADCIAKPTSSGEIGGAEAFKRDLIAKVKNWGEHARRHRTRSSRSVWVPGKSALAKRPGAAEIVLRDPPRRFRPECLAIGSSTGGPQALVKVLGMLGRTAHLPIFVTQHMPATFTTILAEHLGRASGMPSAEARDGEAVVSGRIYVAPGDHHMTVQLEMGGKVLRVDKGPPENFCRPAVDPMLRSIARAFEGRALAVILTGMGQDGRQGALEMVGAGGVVIAQDEATSVVWGMPGAVATSRLCSAVLPLSDIGPYLRKAVSRTAA